MATRALTSESFEPTLEGNDLVLVDFWAGWCGPCRRFAPVYEAVSGRYPDVVFGKVDTEAQPQLSAAAGIRSIPTLMIFRERVLLFAQPGALPESALVELIEQAKALDMDEVRRQVAAAAAAGATA